MFKAYVCCKMKPVVLKTLFKTQVVIILETYFNISSAPNVFSVTLFLVLSIEWLMKQNVYLVV